MAFYWFKKNKKWIIKALDRSTGKTVAWVTGDRDATTFQRLYEKVKHVENCVFYTDNWDSFSEVLPKEKQVIGKTHTVAIERDNSNMRHHLGRMTRRTKIVSKSERMINVSIKLWCLLNTPETFEIFQNKFLAIF